MSDESKTTNGNAIASPVETRQTEMMVRLQVNGGDTFSGPIPTSDVVHLALDRLLPSAYKHNHRISVYKGENLIYPDGFHCEIVEN
jgi:hypothetical protein